MGSNDEAVQFFWVPYQFTCGPRARGAGLGEDVTGYEWEAVPVRMTPRGAFIQIIRRLRPKIIASTPHRSQTTIMSSHPCTPISLVAQQAHDVDQSP